MSPRGIAILFWVCIVGFFLNMLLFAFSSKVPGDSGGDQFAVNMILFAFGAAVNYMHLPKSE